MTPQGSCPVWIILSSRPAHSDRQVLLLFSPRSFLRERHLSSPPGQPPRSLREIRVKSVRMDPDRGEKLSPHLGWNSAVRLSPPAPPFLPRVTWGVLRRAPSRTGEEEHEQRPTLSGDIRLLYKWRNYTNEVIWIWTAMYIIILNLIYLQIKAIS